MSLAKAASVIIKGIYSVLPFKITMFSMIKIFLPLPVRLYRHLHFRGEFKVEESESICFHLYHPGYIIENEIFWRGLYGSWEADSLKLWAGLVKYSNEVLDVGANTGVYSILAKAVNPSVIVHSFEPNSKYYPVILRNKKINRFDINVYNFGIGSKDGEAFIDDYSGEERFIQTTLRSIDSLIDDGTIRNVDLLKIDVELLEVEVLKGFVKHIHHNRPAIIIEVLNTEIAMAIDVLIRGLGYLKYNISESGSIRQTEFIKKSDHWNYLLCTPEQALKIGLNRKSYRGISIVPLATN